MGIKPLFLAFALAFVCTNVHADDITADVSFDLQYINGASSEDISSSFVWDRSTQTLIPGMITSSSGSLGTFNFSGYTIGFNPSNDLGGVSYSYLFDFSNAAGDVFGFDVTNIFGADNFYHWVDSDSLTGPGTSGYRPTGSVPISTERAGRRDPRTWDVAAAGNGSTCVGLAWLETENRGTRYVSGKKSRSKFRLGQV